MVSLADRALRNGPCFTYPFSKCEGKSVFPDNTARLSNHGSYIIKLDPSCG